MVGSEVSAPPPPDVGDPPSRTPNAPPDFGGFWTATIAALDQVPFDVRRTTRPGPDPGTRAHAISFRSWQRRRIHGYALTWDDDRPRPLVVHAHGYRSRVTPRVDWLRAGCHVLGFDIRGFGQSVDAVVSPSPDGWLLTGARHPETSVLRGAVCDYVRALQVAADLEVATRRLVGHGVSLAGGLATMAEAVAGRADLLVLGVPTFGWAEGRRLLVERGSGAEIAHFLERHPEYPEDDLQTVMSYFDAALFAPAIRCATLIGIGEIDRVVPSPCVRAIAARLRAPHEIMTFPVSHDSGPAMRAWDAFDRRWLQLARDGLPDGFGAQPSVAAASTQPR